MLLKNDNALYEVDNVWLGPPGYPLPWAARYSAYGIGLLIFMVALAGFHITGFGFGIIQGAVSLAAAVGFTTVIHHYIDAERPARTVATTFRNEIFAERAPARVKRTVTVPAARQRKAGR